MTALADPVDELAGLATAPSAGTGATGYARSFLAVLSRDILVTWREFGAFLAQVILQPLFMIFVFGKVLTSLGFATEQFSEILLPGIVALTGFITALQSTALPLVLDFSFSREIEDRLLAPVPTGAIALEKLVFSTMRAVLAGVVMYPIGVAVLGNVGWHTSAMPLMFGILVLDALVGSAIGMTLGTLVPPTKISIMFAVVLTPLLFTGATQYPWASLDHLRWFQVVTAFNPLTYASEAMRGAALGDGIPHMALWICPLALVGFLAVFTYVGVRGFWRRAID